jgi:ribose 5-phosphate isomerase B
MKIFIGADHRGFELKKILLVFLEKKGLEVFDVGNRVLDKSDDYPDFGRKVGKAVSKSKGSAGIAICGSGAGICMAANKVKGVRAVLAFDEKIAKASRQDDDSNVLCLGSDFVGANKVEAIVETFLKTSFKKIDRYKRRVRKLNSL